MVNCEILWYRVNLIFRVVEEISHKHEALSVWTKISTIFLSFHPSD